MTKFYTLSILALSLVTGITATAQVGINTTEPHESAVLDVVSTDKGMLIPRLTLSQRSGITNPATGLFIYQTDNTPGFYYYNGSAWQQLSPGVGSGTYVDLTTAQNIGGEKKFITDLVVNSHTVGRGKGDVPSNVAFGSASLAANTTGSSNTAIGPSSLSSNTTGRLNTAVGFQALDKNTSGVYNTATGALALASTTTGNSNTAVGMSSLNLNTTGSDNTATGLYTLRANTTGRFNTVSGSNSSFRNTTGFGNTATGYQSLYLNTTGANNTALGVNALYANTTGNYNTGLGYGANVSFDGLTNAMAMGYDAIVDASNKVQIGNAAVTAVKLGGTAAVLETSQVKLTGGSPGANKVLTSDANGLATWQTPSTGTATSKMRSVTLDAASLDATTTLSIIPGTKKNYGLYQAPVLSLAEGEEQQFQTQVPIPSDWNGTTPITLTVLYSSPTTGNDFYTTMFYNIAGLNGSISSSLYGSFLTAPESSVANGLMEASLSLAAASTSKIVLLGFRRRGTVTQDSSTSEMLIHGVRIDYFD